MTVLLLSTHLDGGGITAYLRTLCRGLRREGDRTIVATAGGRLETEFLDAGVEIRRSPFRTKSELDLRLHRALPALARWIRNEGVDVMHAQTRVTQVAGRRLQRMTGVPLVTTCHGFFRPRWGRRLFPCWGDRVIAVSRPVAAHLREDFRVPQERIRVVPNGVDIEDFRPEGLPDRLELRRRFGIPSGARVLVIVGRVCGVKGHEVLLDAMPGVLRVCPEALLIVAGEGRDLAALRGRCALPPLKDVVRFLPKIERTAEILAACDLFVMPSLQEGLGIAALEAQASGLPVVASRVGGLPDAVDEGRTGLLVPPGDAAALAEAVVALLSDPDRAAAMGAAGREWVGRRFSSDRMAAETRAVYEEVLKRAGGAS